MSKLMKSVSGIRGVVGETLTPELIMQSACGFAAYCNCGTVVLGTDSRPTGSAVAKMTESVLELCGCKVINVGIVPTPTVQLMVEELKADGGIVISASHNPVEWNAFKLINANGTFLNSKEIKKFFTLCEKDPKIKKFDKIGQAYIDDRAFALHIEKVLGVINANKIKKKKFKIALDSVNGAGSYITQDLLEKLGCDVETVHCTIDGTFPRVAEPLPENLGDLEKLVKKCKADIGFAQDPDADRLAIVDDKGRAIGEELTIALVAEHLLSKEPGRVVVNLSTTKTVEDVAIKYGCEFSRAKVGEINVVDEMRKKPVRIGGEGNGGVISPEVHLGRDSLVGIGYILDMMAERKKSISELVSELGLYSMKKGKVSFKPDKLEAIYSRFKDEFKGEKISTIDGMRIDFSKHESFKGGWVHLRPSNTEPIFRIICEGVSDKQMNDIYNYFLKGMKSV